MAQSMFRNLQGKFFCAILFLFLMSQIHSDPLLSQIHSSHHLVSSKLAGAIDTGVLGRLSPIVFELVKRYHDNFAILVKRYHDKFAVF